MIGPRAGAVALALVASAGCAGGDQGDSRADPSAVSIVSGDPTVTSDTSTDATPTTGAPGSTSTGAPEGTSTGSSDGGEASTTEALLSTGASGSSTGEGSSTGVVVGCGDAVIDAPELCDDGNMIDGDGCNADCTLSGQLLWSTMQAGDVGLADEAIGCAVDELGAVYVTGYLSVGPDNDDLWARKYSFGGAPLWTVTQAGTAMLADQGRGIVVDPAQSVYVAGFANTLGQDNNVLVRRLAPDGATTWTKAFNGVANLADTASAAALTAEGDLLVAGATSVAGAGTDAWLRKYSPEGTVLWTRGHAGASKSNDGINAMSLTADGYIYAAGHEGVTGEGTNTWLARYDADGNEIWSRLYSGPASKNDYLYGAVALDDGGVVVCGYQTELEIPWSSFVRRYDSAGLMVWTEIDAGPELLGALCYGLDVADNGDILFAGATMQGMTREPRVRRLTADGAELWSTIVPGAGKGASQGRCVKAAPDGTIVVSGSQDEGTDGRDIWVARFSP